MTCRYFAPAATGALLLAAVACGTRDNEPAAKAPAKGGSEPEVASEPKKPAPTTPKESRVIDVNSSDDLLELQKQYQGMWDSGFEGQLEVRIAAGTYTPVSWSLAPSLHSARRTEAPRIDVVLRGESAAIPGPNEIDARSFSIEGLILTRQNAVTRISVQSALSMKGCLVVNGRGGARSRGPMFAITARGDGSGTRTPVTVRIEDSWFVRNVERGAAMAMLGFAAAIEDPGFYEEISIRRSAFLGNAFDRDIEIAVAKSVRIEDSFFYRTKAGGKLLKCTSTAGVAIDNTVIVVQDVGHVAEVVSTPPVALKGSRIYSEGWKSGAKPPAELAIDPVLILDRKAFEANEAVVAEMVQMKGDQMPGAELWEKLAGALRPGQ